MLSFNIKSKKTALIFSLIVFLLYLFLYLPDFVNLQTKTIFSSDWLIFNQPDEAVNYFFIRNFIFNKNFTVYSPLSADFQQQIHPRSVTVVYNHLTPIGFPGLVFFWSIFLSLLPKFSFNFFVISLTPALAVLSLWLFYKSLKIIFNKHIAVWSVFFLSSLAPWWYYASRPLQHNLLVVFLLILALYFFSLDIKKPRKIFIFLTGLSLGLSLVIRISEFFWLSFLWLALLFYLIKKKRLFDISLLVLTGILSLFLFLAIQYTFYFSFFGTGYLKPINGQAGNVLLAYSPLVLIKKIILPFGFNLKNIIRNFYFYFIKLNLNWFFLVIIGLFVVFKNKYQNFKIYFYIWLFFSLYLLINYGSWLFNDNLACKPTIATSYMRYFLPVYVGAIPFVSLAYQKIKFKKILIVIWLLLSVYYVFFSLEGLVMVKRAVNQYYIYQNKIENLTPESAIIITRYSDKYVFPHRQVIVDFSLPVQQNVIVDLLKRGYEVYWFDLELTEQDLKLFNKLNIDFSAPLYQDKNIYLRKLNLK